jgi:pentatricopeptide repeat protein
MQLFVKGEDMEGARGVMAEMKQAGVRCNEVTYNSLMNCYARQRTGGMLKHAEQLLSTMDAAGLWADKYTFGALLRCCWRPRNALRAEHWFRQAVTVYEVQPNPTLADIFQKSVGMERALVVCSELRVDLRQLLAAVGKGKGKGKGGKGGKGRGRGGGNSRGGRDSGHSSGGGNRGRQQSGDHGGHSGTGGNGEKGRW